MKIKISLLVFAFLASLSTFSQQVDKKDDILRYDHAIGIGAGFTTGFGFSYKYCPNKYGFMINVGPYSQNYGELATYSLGLTFLKKIAENPYNNFYVYLSNSYLYNRYQTYNYFSTYTQIAYETTEQWNTGLGIGFEFDARKRVVMNIMVGYAQYNTFQNLFPTIEASLHYRFNGSF